MLPIEPTLCGFQYMEKEISTGTCRLLLSVSESEGMPYLHKLPYQTSSKNRCKVASIEAVAYQRITSQSNPSLFHP